MKTLVLSLAVASVLLVSSTASAGIRVRVGRVGVAVGGRVARPVRPVYAAPRATRATVVQGRHYAAREIVEERRDTFQDVVEERRDTALDTREERVDRALDIIERRRQIWAQLQALQP